MAAQTLQILSLGLLIVSNMLLPGLTSPDGGGVRGISSLHILSQLFVYINAELAQLHRQAGLPVVDAVPAEVFGSATSIGEEHLLCRLRFYLFHLFLCP